jgi:hypothetical protein
MPVVGETPASAEGAQGTAVRIVAKITAGFRSAKLARLSRSERRQTLAQVFGEEILDQTPVFRRSKPYAAAAIAWNDDQLRIQCGVNRSIATCCASLVGFGNEFGAEGA